MINKPTHFIIESSSCIGIIFSSNTIFELGKWTSDLRKMYHNIIYGTLNLNIPLPPPYYRDVWDSKHANTESIQKAIFEKELCYSTFYWSKAFLHRNANEKYKY